MTDRAAWREAARAQAEDALREAGFHIADDGRWSGELEVVGFGAVAATMSLPARFPTKLPEVFVDPTVFGRQVPHVGSDGKVCAAAEEATQLDFDAPRALVSQMLELVRSTLADGIGGKRESDLQEEFLAYWNPTCSRMAGSICAPRGPAREIAALSQRARLPSGQRLLLADSVREARRFLSRVGIRGGKRECPAILVPIPVAFPPPEADERLAIGTLLEILADVESAADRELVSRFLATHKPPYLVLLVLPATKEAARIIVGVSICPPPARAKAVLKGFRPQKAPYERMLGLMRDEPTLHVAVGRLDGEYLAPRGGAKSSLLAECVVVVGLGSLGSMLAQKLAGMGVGKLILVDAEKLAPENVHRHFLGMADVGESKVGAVGTALCSRFPHLDVVPHHVDLESAMDSTPGLLADAGLIVFATGDHTLELLMNRVMGKSVRRVHTWVEPLGIGGHALACGFPAGRGCLRCLYRLSDRWGLRNVSSLIGPGQPTNRTMAGCAGTFTPFSGLDCDRTALEAAKLVGRVLEGLESSATCVTWSGDLSRATATGFRLSRRASALGPNALVTTADFVDSECQDCR